MYNDESIERIIKDEDLIQKIEETTLKHYKNIYEFVRQIKICEEELKELKGNLSLTKKTKELKSKINSEFKRLFSFANENKFYWCNPTLKTYKFYFKIFLSNFKRATEEEKTIYFLKHELEHFSNFSKNNFIVKDDFKTNLIHRTDIIDSFTFIDYTPYLYDINMMKIKIQNQKIIEFLITEIKKEGFKVKEKNGQYHLKNNVGNTNSPTIEEVDKPLTQKDLPKFDTLDRYELLKELKIDSIIHNLDTSQKSKYKILALIMGTHPDTARKLLTNKYPKLKSKEEITNLTLEANKNVLHFLNNPINSIKIP